MKNLSTYFFIFTLLGAGSAIAAEKMKPIKLPEISSYGRTESTAKRMIASDSSSVTVSKVENSKFDAAEKWIDHSTGVVCYSIGSVNKKSISCVKLK